MTVVVAKGHDTILLPYVPPVASSDANIDTMIMTDELLRHLSITKVPPPVTL